MWFVPAFFVAEVLSMPPESPIACQICRNENTPPAIFSGTVRLAGPNQLGIFDGKVHQTMTFSFPAGFRGVSSSDGVIKDAGIASVKSGLLARVSYRTVGDRREPITVLLLTIQQCRALQAAEHISKSKIDCPD
jgi:hypothetical protein